LVERRRRRRDGGFTLQINILTVFATLLVTTVIALMSFAYYKNSRSILDLAERFVARVAASGIERTTALLDPVEANVLATARLAALDEAKARDGTLFPYLTSLLASAPQLQSVYLAFESDGRFLQAFSIPPGTKRFGANDAEPPPGARFALRVIDRSQGYSDTWTYITADGSEVGRETSNGLNYDPRPRPWYQDALSTRGLVWSDLLVYTSSRQPGITAAAPIILADRRVIGAAAANVATTQLSSFLAGLDLGRSGTALVVDEQERLIAHPDPARTVRVDGLKASLVKVDELGDPVISAAFAAHRAGSDTLVRFDMEGRRYIGSFTRFPADFGKKWLLAIIVEEDDFVGTLKENNRELVLVGLGLLVAGMVGVGILSRWITQPIVRLVTEIDKIRKFDLGGPIAMHAMVSEVNQLIQALNMMKRALRTFGMFVPRDLVRELIASGRPIELGGQDRALTVMFTDIADFTSLSEHMQPGELLVHVSRHLAAVSECVGEEFGTVDKYIGDAVMAFWGAPIWREDHALRGCTAALKAHAMQARLNEAWTAEGLPTMVVRIGLHTANVIVGNIGSAQRMSYTAVGDGVNVASRLEGVNKAYGTRICVSEAVVAQAGRDNILVRPLDVVAVKGRKAGEKIYELVALRQGSPELLGTPTQIQICQVTEQAFEAYRQRRWDEAIELYRQLAELAPADRLPPIFIERCRHNAAEPPPPDWSGVFEMKTK
jgi:adenylate cyclase